MTTDEVALIKSSMKVHKPQWPLQLHLVLPDDQAFKVRELLLLSSCAPVVLRNIQEDVLAGRGIVIACPKLDYSSPYPAKLAAILKEQSIKSLIMVEMEEPCCTDLRKIALEAILISGRKDLSVEEHIVSIDGSRVKIKKIQ